MESFPKPERMDHRFILPLVWLMESGITTWAARDLTQTQAARLGWQDGFLPHLLLLLFLWHGGRKPKEDKGEKLLC